MKGVEMRRLNAAKASPSPRQLMALMAWAPIAFGLIIPLLLAPDPSIGPAEQCTPNITSTAIVGQVELLPPPPSRPCAELSAVPASGPPGKERPDWTPIDRMFAAAEAGQPTVDDVLDVSIELLSLAESGGDSTAQAGVEHAGCLLDDPSRGAVSLTASTTGDRSEQWEMTLERAATPDAQASTLSILYRVSDNGEPECYSLVVPWRVTGGLLSIHRDSASWNGYACETGDGPGSVVDRVGWEDPISLTGSLDDPRAVLIAESLHHLRRHFDGTREPLGSKTCETGIPHWRQQRSM